MFTWIYNELPRSIKCNVDFVSVVVYNLFGF